MAYWQNGKLYLHCSTQSVAQTVPDVARWCGIEPTQVVLICEYTGGGFGSKGGGTVSMSIPALLSKKANAPVMMRITREDESYIGRARTNMTGRTRIGFAKDGRITALDLFIVQDNGAYGPMGDHRSAGLAASIIYQPPAMRWRAINVLTNTPPRSQQRSPGPMQANGMIEPLITKAAKQLGIDQVEIRKINSPVGRALFGPARPERPASAPHERVHQRGARQRQADVPLGRAQGVLGPAPRSEGARRRRRRRPARRRIDRLRQPDDDSSGRQAVRPVGRRQPRHAFGDGPGARRGGSAGDAVGEGRSRLGRHGQRRAVVVPLGGQPDDARDDARELRGCQGREAQAAGDRREGSRRLAGRLRAGQRARVSPRQSGRRADLRAGGEARDRAWRQVRRPRGARRHQRDDQARGRDARGPRR